MFTGIVQAVGRVSGRQGPSLQIHSPDAWPAEPWVIGESVAVNGVCLTVVQSAPSPDGALLLFDISEETYAKTSLDSLQESSAVNLERAMRPVDRYGGHIVQGHVDQTGTVVSIEQNPASWTVTFDVGPQNAKYLFNKASVCLDGISLTVVDPQQGQFQVAVIPHTWQNTALSTKKPGDKINVEFDVLTKTVENLLAHTRP